MPFVAQNNFKPIYTRGCFNILKHPLCYLYLILMMEQTNTCKCHSNTVFIAGFNNMIITY